MAEAAVVRIARGRDASARARHPWLFSGAVASVDGSAAAGDEVVVVDHEGTYVATGLYNPHSGIRVRLYRWDEGRLDEAFFRGRVDEALRLRRDVLGLDDPDGAARLVFSEGDGLSGITVDRYGAHVTVQLTSLALAQREAWLLDAIARTMTVESMTLRTERGVLEEEGLRLEDGPLRGTTPERAVRIREGSLTYDVSIATGQKTGFYIDQRLNRARAASYARGRSVADVCCYTGAFGLAALAAGAERVVGVDVSSSALELATVNARANGLDARHSVVRSDAFRWLGEQAEAGARYDMLVLDPPRFARSKRGVPEALRAYRSLNASALRCLAPRGVLVTCSCSGRVSAADFQGSVARAAADVGRHLRVVERLGQPPDHPVAASCPESEYLKCLVCLVD